MIGKSDRMTNGKTQFEVVAFDGMIFGPFGSAEAAAAFARKRWPDQEQDEERTGKGWDVQVVGAD